MDNIYVPHLAEIVGIRQETPDIKTFNFKFIDSRITEKFTYYPGQFIECSVLSVGEAPFCLADSPTRKNGIECSIKKMGNVTQALHELEAGDIVGIRGPYGNGFPVENLQKKNLLFVAGGIGLAPLRSLINYCLDLRSAFKKITIVSGARTSKDLVYAQEYKNWQEARDMAVHTTIDCQEDNWTCLVGVVPEILEKLQPSCQEAVAIVCGPPVMIRYTIPVLLKLGFCPETIITTLEMKMKCGLGKCGRCNIDHLYICKDGPVFTYQQLKELNYEL